MPSTKRKRDYATPTSNDSDVASKFSEPVPQDPVPFTSVPFTVEYTKIGDTKLKKRRSGGKDKIDDNNHTEGKAELGIGDGDAPVTYMILPGSEWEAMKKYKNFIVADKTFGINDFVYVNNGQVAQGEETDDDKQFWIARVLEVRASSPSAVYLRVYWLYWPSELPSGIEYYHGKSELVASNHMEIIDAMTVSGKAEVMHLVESDDALAVTGLYWRQRFDFRTQKVSTLKKDCICKRYHNPDNLLIHCLNPSCAKWMHQECVLNAALDKAWTSLTGISSSEQPDGVIQVNGKSEEEEDTIQVALKVNGSSLAKDVPKSSAGKSKSRRKSKSKRANIDGPDWHGQLEARLQMKAVAEGDDGDTEITGSVILTDLRGKEPKTWHEPLTCLFCQHSLQESS